MPAFGVPNLFDNQLALTWAASITAPDLSANRYFTVTATSNIAATLPNPTNPPGASQSNEFTVEFLNSSGGALTTPIAFGAAYKTTGGVSPGNGLTIIIKFRYNSARSLAIEVCRTSAAV